MKSTILGCVGWVLVLNTLAWSDALPADTDPEESEQLFAWIKLGSDDTGYLDYDGKVADETTFVDEYSGETLFYGMADADVSRVGGGSVKAVAIKYYHDFISFEDMGLPDSGASLGMASATYKPFVVTSDTLSDGDATLCTMNVVYDGLIVLQEEMAGEYSAAQIDFSFEVIDSADDANSFVVTADGDDVCYEGQLRIEDAYDGTTHTYTDVEDMAPEVIVDLDAEELGEDPEDNYWAQDGSEYVTIVEIDTTDPSQFTVLQGSLDAVPENIQAAILDNEYDAAGNKIYYVVYDQTSTFEAVVGQTYWVTMDSHAAAQTSLGSTDLMQNETLVVCDFSNTALYAMDLEGASARTWIEVSDPNVFGDDGAGSAEINGAVMQWTADVNLANELALTGTESTTIDTDEYAASLGNITGTGGLIKTGTGTLSLAEDCNFTGDTVVEEGTLVVNGDYQSDILVEGGILGGSGTFQGITGTSGVIAPGNSIGTMTLSEAFVLDGSTLEVELDDSGNADKIVAPSAELLSGTIRAVPTEAITTTQDYTIIETADGITGDLSAISKEISDRAYLLDFDLNIVDDDLILSATQVQSFSDMTAAATDPTFGDVAGILDDAVTAGIGGSQVGALQALDEDSLNEAVGQLQPNITRAAGLVANQQAALVGQSTQGRIGAVQFAMRRAGRYQRAYALADADSQSLPVAQASRAATSMGSLPTPGQWVGFGRSLNDWGEVDGDSLNSGYRWRTHGMDMGLQNLLDENTLVGAGVAYLSSSIHGYDRTGTSDADSLYGSLYASRFTDEWHMDTGLSYGHGWTETTRPITAISERADGDYESDSLGLFLGGGLVRQWGLWEVDSFLRYDYTLREEGGYTETGAGTLNLHVHRNHTDSLRQTLGARLTRVLSSADRTPVYVRFSAAWQHEYLDDQVAGDTDLLGETFRDSSQKIDRDSGLFSAGLGWSARDNVSVFADYTAMVNNDLTSHNVNAGLKILF